MKCALATMACLCALPLCASDRAAQVELRLAVEGGGTVRGLVHVSPAPGEGGGSFEVTAPGTAAIGVPGGGPFQFEFDFPDYLVEPVALAASTPSIHVVLEKAAVLRGRLRLPHGESTLPAEITVFSEDRPQAEERSSGVIVHTLREPKRRSCAVAAGSFACAVPAGRRSFGLRASGYLTKFYWDLDVQHRSTKDLGELTLVRGASVVGWVVSGSAAVPSVGLAANLELVPAARGAGRGAGAESLRTVSAKARVDGFFEFAGVPPGAYSLVARLPGHADGVHDGIVAYAGSESRLREPLVLFPPSPLDVLLDPPLAPDGSRWQLTMLRSGAARGHAHAAVKGAADDTGRFSSPQVPPGGWLIEVADGRGNLAHREEREIEVGDRVWVSLQIVEIHGALSLGRQALAETDFALHGGHGQRLRLRSDAKGRFDGYVTAPGRWQATIGDLREGWDRVPVDVPKGGGRVDVAFPAGTVRGEIRDEAGRQVAGAFLQLIAEQRLLVAQSDAVGRFRFRGLKEGEYSLVAAVDQPPASAVVSARADEGEDGAATAVVLRRELPVRARVLSAQGPVERARVILFGRAPGLPGPVSTRVATSDGQGLASISHAAAAATVHWVVQSPGFALHTEGSRPPGRQVEFVLGQEAGTLKLVQPTKVAEESDGWLVQLVREGVGVVPFGVVQEWAASQGRVWSEGHEAKSIEVPMMEPGRYAWCRFKDAQETARATGDGVVPVGRCSSGTLQAFSHLDLRLPD